MATTAIDKEAIWEALAEIPDPEIPVINIIELGVVRDVKADGQGVEVIITPTYSGCRKEHYGRIEKFTLRRP